MAVNDVESIKQILVDLNKKIGEMEQVRDENARKFFETHLSNELIFRRANGEVVGKSEPGGFLKSLEKPTPFTSRDPEDISVTLIGNRALVTLIVVTKAGGSSVAIATSAFFEVRRRLDS